MSKKIVVQAYNSDTGVIGPVESESACVQQFINQSGAVSVGMFVCISILNGKAQPAQANSNLTLAYGIVTKLITNTLCEVMSSGVTTLTVPGAQKGDTLYLSNSAGGIVTRDITNLDSDGFYLQPVARVLGVATGSVCTIQLLIAGAPVADLSNLLKLDRFVYASNNSSPGAGNGALVIGGNDEDLFESSSPSGVPYKLEVQGLTKTSGLESSGQVSAASAEIAGAITADSAEIAGAITADSAEIAGAITANSASLAGSLFITGENSSLFLANGFISAQKTSGALGGIVYAQTKIACGDDSTSPNVAIVGSTGKITSFNPTVGSYGSISVNRLAADTDIDALERLAFIQLAASSSNAVTPSGGAWVYSSAIENWTSGSKASMLSIDVTGTGKTDPNTTTLNIYSNLVRCYTDLSMWGGSDSSDIVFEGPNPGTVLPFTGSHVYPCDTEIPVGSCVVLNEGKAEISNSAMAKNCVGLAIKSTVRDTDSLSGTSEGLKVVVAAVGDNRSGPLTGFLVCYEGGPVYAGDLLCTSSTPGYLMKQPDDIVRSYTVGKALQNVTFDSDGKASGVYGTICCG